ncbi:F-box protein [Trifolium repens]|nr:F-box protein [Trifolium repens]
MFTSPRLDDRRCFVSGLHFNSLRVVNKFASAGEISLSFIFLQLTTLRHSRSFHDSITDSKPSVVSNEHASMSNSFIRLKMKQQQQPLSNS